MNNKSEKKILKSFDRSYSSYIFFKKPNKYRELENHPRSNESIITIGANYSYAPMGFDKNSLVIDLSSFNRILDFNIDKKEITVEAGITIYDFLKFTLRYNMWLPQIPGYPFISMGGIVATNAHGKSCGIHGTIRKSIKKIRLFHKTNGWLNLSENENKEIFDLTVGGLGLTGTIVAITFSLTELKSHRFETQIEEVISIQDCLKKIIKDNDNEFFTYSWNRADSLKNFGSGFIYKNKLENNKNKINGHLRKLSQKKISNFLPFSLWNTFTINIANNIYYITEKNKKNKSIEDLIQVIFPYVGKESYFKLFGPKGFIESQILISPEKVGVFMDEFITYFKKQKPTITLFSLKKIKGEHNYLRFEDSGVCVSFDFTNDKKNIEFLNLIDKLCIKHKAIPSIIKDSRLDLNTVRNCYAYYQDFKNKLKNYDNKRIYQSTVSRKLDL